MSIPAKPTAPMIPEEGGMPVCQPWCEDPPLYHALDYCEGASNHYVYRKYKWLNLKKLASMFVFGKDTLEEVLYFTTIATWDAGKTARHKLYIRALENEGVRTIYGEFKRKQKHCNVCKKDFWSFEEKQTDVNIALALFQLAILDRYDKAIIISGDTDLLPAVKSVRSVFLGKQIGLVIPIGRRSEDFKQQVDFHHRCESTILLKVCFQTRWSWLMVHRSIVLRAGIRVPTVGVACETVEALKYSIT